MFLEGFSYKQVTMLPYVDQVESRRRTEAPSRLDVPTCRGKKIHDVLHTRPRPVRNLQFGLLLRLRVCCVLRTVELR